jgi:hypothetical protein
VEIFACDSSSYELQCSPTRVAQHGVSAISPFWSNLHSFSDFFSIYLLGKRHNYLLLTMVLSMGIPRAVPWTPGGTQSHTPDQSNRKPSSFRHPPSAIWINALMHCKLLLHCVTSCSARSATFFMCFRLLCRSQDYLSHKVCVALLPSLILFPVGLIPWSPPLFCIHFHRVPWFSGGFALYTYIELHGSDAVILHTLP